MPFRPALGTSDFQKLRESGADYVDKTGWIAEVLEDQVEILLFSRPRRFGKTLNLSTLRYFVEKSPADLSAIFDDLEIWQNPYARAHFQRHPVTWITFKDVKFNTWALTFAAIRTEIQRMYEAHRYLLEEGTLVPEAVERFKTILRREGPEELYSSALKDLTAHLAHHHCERVVILIDEYDTPIQAGFTYGFYDQVVLFFRAFFSAGLKDNPHVFKGVLTGILRIARESLFSGLNNIIVYSILTKRHGTAFGFTEPEVARILEAERYPERMEAVRRWYNGYLFGGQTIYNPWSVLSYVSDEEHRLRPWWLMTSSDDLLRELMLTRGYGLNADMEELLRGGTIEKRIDISWSIAPYPTATENRVRPGWRHENPMHTSGSCASW